MYSAKLELCLFPHARSFVTSLQHCSETTHMQENVCQINNMLTISFILLLEHFQPFRKPNRSQKNKIIVNSGETSSVRVGLKTTRPNITFWGRTSYRLSKGRTQVCSFAVVLQSPHHCAVYQRALYLVGRYNHVFLVPS